MGFPEVIYKSGGKVECISDYGVNSLCKLLSPDKPPPPSHPNGWRGQICFRTACGGVITIAYDPIATQLLSYLLGEWPMTKRVIDQEIEKNKELTTNIKGAVERQFKKSA